MAGKRPKSPNFPAFGLGDAIEKLGRIFKQHGKQRLHPGVAVRSLGYNSLNGTSLRAISALRQYGLLEDIEDDVKISDMGIRILHGEDSERLDLLREAAKRPRVFAELLPDDATDLPSDESLRARLLTKMNFSTPKAAQLCVDAFRETVNVAKLTDNDYINAQSEHAGKLKEEEAQKRKFDSGFAGFFGGLTRKSNDNKQMNNNESKSQSFVKVWSLTGGTAAKLEINNIPSKKDQEFLKLCLERALEELREVEENQSPQDSPVKAQRKIDLE
jgi:hypothetical protein